LDLISLSIRAVEQGEMPMSIYLLLHSTANADKDKLKKLKDWYNEKYK